MCYLKNFVHHTLGHAENTWNFKKLNSTMDLCFCFTYLQNQFSISMLGKKKKKNCSQTYWFNDTNIIYLAHNSLGWQFSLGSAGQRTSAGQGNLNCNWPMTEVSVWTIWELKTAGRPSHQEYPRLLWDWISITILQWMSENNPLPLPARGGEKEIHGSILFLTSSPSGKSI